MKHLDRYVNEWTIALGKEKHRAFDCLSKRAKDIGLVAANAPCLEVLDA